MTASIRDWRLIGAVAVGAVTIMLAIATLGLAFAAVILLSWISGPILNVDAPPNAPLFLLLIVGVGAASFACALGLPKGKSWAWTGSVVLAVVAFGAFLFSHLPGSAGLIGLGVASGALVALFLPQTRCRFGR